MDPNMIKYSPHLNLQSQRAAVYRLIHIMVLLALGAVGMMGHKNNHFPMVLPDR